VCAVVAYGALLPAEVLGVPEHGFVNLHFSLLPRWRGAAPVQHALRAGDTVTGVTTFVLDEGMDTGPVLEQVEVPIRPDESAGDLLDRLAVLGGPVLARSLRSLVQGTRPRPQPEGRATLAPKISADDVRMTFDVPPRQLVDLVRSADPAPGAHTLFRGERLKVFRVTPVDPGDGGTDHPAVDPGDGGTDLPPDSGPGHDVDPGTILRVDKRGAVVACADGAVRLDEVQPTGKARMDGVAFVNGYRPEAGERLGAQP
jgi:methionyl-tRNA formyltransferase